VSSDPDSDALVVEALVAAGQDPEGSIWRQGATVLAQLRSAEGADGGFAYPGKPEDAFTTSQVPAAFMRLPYAGAAHWIAGRSLPAIECAGSSPSAGAAASSPGQSGPALPWPLLYGVVALLGLIVVLGGTWVVKARSRRR
jgi:hypothetical protein